MTASTSAAGNLLGGRRQGPRERRRLAVGRQRGQVLDVSSGRPSENSISCSSKSSLSFSHHFSNLPAAWSKRVTPDGVVGDAHRGRASSRKISAGCSSRLARGSSTPAGTAAARPAGWPPSAAASSELPLHAARACRRPGSRTPPPADRRGGDREHRGEAVTLVQGSVCTLGRGFTMWDRFGADFGFGWCGPVRRPSSAPSARASSPS